jgi:hypothetical protein
MPTGDDAHMQAVAAIAVRKLSRVSHEFLQGRGGEFLIKNHRVAQSSFDHGKQRVYFVSRSSQQHDITPARCRHLSQLPVGERARHLVINFRQVNWLSVRI